MAREIPWDLGMPIGYGETIREALEDFDAEYFLDKDKEPEYKWT